MSNEKETHSGVSESPESVSLRKSRPAVLFLAMICVLGAVLSAVAFVFQSMYRFPSGELFREMPLAWLSLLGHLLRAVGLGAIGWALGRYARSAKVGLGTDTARARLFADLGLFWIVLSLFIGVMLIYSFGSLGLLRREQNAKPAAGGQQL